MHLALVPIVIGIVSAMKELGLPGKFAAIVAIVIGLLGSWLIGGTLLAIILGGIVVGLSASGLYSGSVALKPNPLKE